MITARVRTWAKVGLGPRQQAGCDGATVRDEHHREGSILVNGAIGGTQRALEQVVTALILMIGRIRSFDTIAQGQVGRRQFLRQGAQGQRGSFVAFGLRPCRQSR